MLFVFGRSRYHTMLIFMTCVVMAAALVIALQSGVRAQSPEPTEPEPIMTMAPDVGSPPQSDQPDFDPDQPAPDVIISAESSTSGLDASGTRLLDHEPLDFGNDIAQSDGAVDASALNAQPKFLYLPFEQDGSMRVQQGYVYTWNSPHGGIDFIRGTIDNSSTWTTFAVRASADGYACGNCSSRLGNAVFIKHTNGTYTYYGHLSSIVSTIPQGDSSKTVFVKKGEIIGMAGDTGTTRGWIHLHFQVNSGSSKPDPYALNTSDRNRYYPAGASYTGMGVDYMFLSDPPPYSVGAKAVVDRVWTSDGSDNWNTVKTTFTAGDKIRLVSKINNQFGSSITASVRMIATGPNGYKLRNLSNSLVLPAGWSTWSTLVTIPTGAPAGTYTFITEVTYQNSTQRRQTTFSVRDITCSIYRAEYYNNISLSGYPALVRCEGWPISADWGSGSPASNIQVDNFSARWKGTAYFDAGMYEFMARVDDGIRVWLDSTLIIDSWRDQGATTYYSTRYVSAGTHQVKVEYYERGGGATAQFRWTQLTGTNNIAKNRTAYATSMQSSDFAPSRGNDGNTGTRWSSRSSLLLEPQWWWLDLGSRLSFNRMVVRWETAYASRYFVGWSNDDVNYTGIWVDAKSAGTQYFRFGTTAARYLAVYMEKRAGVYMNYSFWEVEAYQVAGQTVQSASEETGITLTHAENDAAGDVWIQVEGDTPFAAVESELVTLTKAEIADMYRIYLPAVDNE